MGRKIQILSDLQGRIKATGVGGIEGDDDRPAGCAVVPDEDDRVDRFELDDEIENLSSQEFFRRVTIRRGRGKISLDD